MRENWEIHWKDYYQVLQLHPSAEPEVIKAAYDRLARKYHPDISQNPTANQRMKELNEAWEILGNPEKKKRYDLAYYRQKGQDSSSNARHTTYAKPRPEAKHQKSSRLKRVVLLLACIFIVATAVTVWQLLQPSEPTRTTTSTSVSLQPSNLKFNTKIEAAIRNKIDKPSGDISQSDLKSLFELDLSGSGIVDIAGLEYCTSLRTLVISNNPITDLSPISNLTSLTSLSIYRCQVTDISPLSKLTNLEWLNMHHLQVSDISPLSSLTKLDWLYLSYNPASDISPLSNLKKLRTLSLSHMEITDISVLAGLPNLHESYLEGNFISDISPLVENTGLGWGDTIYLSDNPLSDESVHVNIPRLEERGVTVK